MRTLYLSDRRVTKRILLVLIAFAYVSGLFAQPGEEHFFRWDNKALLQKIKAAPMDQNYTAQRAKNNNAPPANQRPNPEEIAPVRIDLPMFDGSTQTFNVIESPVLEDTNDPNWISVKTYQGHSDDFKTTIRISVSSFGVTIFILTPQGMRTIQPVNVSANQYKISAAGTPEFNCGTEAVRELVAAVSSSCNSFSGQLRTYRIAVAATGEYTTFRGGAAQVQSDITNLISYLNLLYEGEMSLHFNVAANNSAIIYTDPNSDPFMPVLGSANPSVGQAGFNSTQITNVMPEANYDIGHVLHYNASLSGLDGRAGLGVVCKSGSKAQGWSQIDLGSNYDLGVYGGIILHEVGHQLGANHPFFSTSGTCNNARVISSAYESGSGTTAMSYNGSCSPDNIGSGRSLYFHITNLNEIAAYLNGGGSGCSSPVTTGNTAPAVNANPNNLTLYIPSRTPFELKGSATDAENNPLTYCWEEYDTDPASGGASPNHAATTSKEPLFRSFLPASSSTRIVPQLSDILANTQTQGEILPQAARSMKFRLTVRDRFTARGLTLGSWSCDEITINVVNVGAQGFEVTSQNTATTWNTSSTQTVTWNVAGTTGAPFNCANVNILFSVDGGNTFPIVLAANTPNDGTENITVPSNIAGITTGRIKVESNCTGNLKYFDINNSDITIKSIFCFAVKSNICNPATVIANAGTQATNLSSPLINYGVPTSAVTLTTTGSVSSSYNATPAASGAGTCTSINNGKGYATFRFRVDKVGSYTFSKNAGGFKRISVYQSSIFNADLPCANNYLGSNSYDIGDGRLGADFSVTLDLIACTDYILVLYDLNGNTTTLDFTNSAGGTVYSINPPATPNYNYTYVAVNTGTGNIDAVSATADFTALPGGNYCVYGLHYYSGAANPPATVTPSSFVGQNFNIVQVSNNCIMFSANCISLILTSVSVTPTLTAGTAINPTTCGGADGKIPFTTNLANGSYTLSYSVGGTATTKTITVASGAFTLSGLNAGIYSAFSITNNGNTGSAASSKTLTDPNAPTLAVGTATNPITCGGTNGSITFATTNLPDGSYILNYSVGGKATTKTVTVATKAFTLSGLNAGIYSAFSITNNGCTGSAAASKTLTDPIQPAPAVTVTQPLCGLTTGTITVTSPSTDATYSFDGGTTYQIGNSKSSLLPNIYLITVKSTVNGSCVSSSTSAVVNSAFTVPNVPTVSVIQPACGATSGTITVFAPSSGVTYSFDGGANYQSSNSKSGLSPGFYSINVKSTNAGNCVSVTTSAVINATIIPAKPAVNVTQPVCGTPTGMITVTTPSSGVTYSFDGGATYQTGNLRSGLQPGNYSIVVKSTSFGNCVSPSTTATVNPAFTVPATPMVTIIQPTFIIGGTITVSAPSSGVTYSFDGGTTYQIGNSKSGLPPNDYFIIVKSTSTGNCVSPQVKVSLVAPLIIVNFGAAAPQLIINCPATPIFTDAPTATDIYNNVLTTTFSDVKTVGSCAGNYSVTRTWFATDAGGKTATTSQTIIVQDITPPTIAPLPQESTVDCQISPVFAQAVANDNCGSVSLTFNDVITPNSNPNQAGYYFTITRIWTAVDGCANSSTASQIIHVRDMPKPTISQDGNLLFASDGAKYQWYIGESVIPGATSQLYYIQTYGDYKVRVTNPLGCMRFSDFIHSDADFQNNCPQIHKNFGASCDDGDPNTINDRVRNDCKCHGDYTSTVIKVICPADINVVSTDKYGTVVTWNEAGMFKAVDGFCNPTDLNVKRTSGYYSGYPFEPSTRIFEEYVATDACGNKSSCSFYVNTSSVPKPAAAAERNKSDNNQNVLSINGKAGVFALFQNIPNPANNSTRIGFNLPVAQPVTFSIFNIAGQTVWTKKMDGVAGYNEVMITRSELNAAGVFFYRLETRDNTATKKMIIQE